jgi:hypothetical protein
MIVLLIKYEISKNELVELYNKQVISKKSLTSTFTDKNVDYIHTQSSAHMDEVITGQVKL